MEKILDIIGKRIEGLTDLDRIERLLELAVRLAEVYARIKGL